MAIHKGVLVPCGRAAVHLHPNTLAFKCQGSEAEGKSWGNSPAMNGIGVPGLSPGWYAEGHSGESDL